MSMEREHLPLAGKRIVLTRATGPQADRGVRALRELGAVPIHVPCIAIAQVSDLSPLKAALARSPDYILVTSANAVAPLAASLAGQTAGFRVGAVGPRTEEALREHGIEVSVRAADFRAEGLLAELARTQRSPRRVLIPTTPGARDVLPRGLADLGAVVDVVHVYETVLPESGSWRPGLLEWQAGGADAVIFTSGSTVKNLLHVLEHESSLDDERPLLDDVDICVIGPLTAKACHEQGLDVAVCPIKYTMDELLKALVEYYR